MELLFIGLLVLAIPFVLPILSWVYAKATRNRLEALEAEVREQAGTIRALESRLGQIRLETQAPAAPVERPFPELHPPKAPTPPAVAAPGPIGPTAVPPPPPVAKRLPPPPPPPRVAPAPASDWESLVGVKLFSAIAGIALVVAAIFFLKYSLDNGWLQPPVRVLIGVATGIALLVVCELKAARRYPATANALDAAAVAILFATFFSAHALWDLIPSLVTFVLLAVVTAVAVLLSIRRESLFIAVLGLLGGFSTPALLSSGQNQPIPLFAYLMLLNLGLAWVAYRQTWPVLTVLTLVLTTIYQWGWVFDFLGQSQLTLAMGIFLVFPVLSIAGLMLARRTPAPMGDAGPGEVVFERTAIVAAAMPLFFAVYLSATPAYGARPWLLFGFLLLVDAGLLAIALARGQGLLHAAGAFATITVVASWLAFSYGSAFTTAALVMCAVFVLFFSTAPVIARRARHPLVDAGADAEYAAPLLLATLAVLGRIEPSFADPLLFAVLLPLLLVIAWRAIAGERGGLYFVAAFFAIATQASWSSAHLSVDRLGTAVAIYAIFGIVSIVVPLVARRSGRPLAPESGGGMVLMASLGLLLFLSFGPIAPAAVWALALLLAILNAGLFVESAGGRLPFLSIAGSVVSWVVLANWWYHAGAAVGVLPSLTVITGLALITFAGHAWADRRSRAAVTDAAPAAVFEEGLYLGLIGHLFLVFIAINREWSLPPWPWLGALAALTLAASVVALATRAGALHVAGASAAGVVVAAWTFATGAPWMLTALAVSGGVSAYALGWLLVARRSGMFGVAATAAGATLLLGEVTAILATLAGGAPPFVATVTAHVLNLSVLLALTWTGRWRQIALWAVVPASAAVAVQWADGDLRTGWTRLLVLGFAVYAVFTAYPIVLGRRARGERDPYLAAVLASVVFFFAARAALNAGGYGWMIGVVPVFEAAVMALLLRALLRMDTGGARDLGRLALIAGASLAFVTVAIPLQLKQQWITIGWALEGAALAWLFRRIPHRGLFYVSLALLGAVFARLALNPDVLIYEPRGSMRILNWYLYAYVICAAAFLLAAYWLRTPKEAGETSVGPTPVLGAAAAVLLFLLLNIEIADFYATGPSIMFRFGANLSQDLTYTIGWLLFGMALLAVCIYLHSRAGRIAALALIAVTTFKCFLYDLASLDGLYRVGSFVGLALCLALVSLAMQKFVFAKPEEAAR